ncbi:MAG: sulfide/dihydroorotate dehydrogenase-like FAD/NAD-binding protein [Endomicrobium sp.]|jgi:ferredoxin--NADP+ reductase|nr:sulfide/dihydroorotate dehydrogenase-like FAD/NAD-binding protein [Endomicrobium sp.]
MYKIVSKKELRPKIRSYEVYAPEIAKSAKAGQFVIFRIDERGERVPLTIAGTNLEKGLVRVVFQEVGKSTMHLASLCEGDYIRDFLGPLGNPTKIKKYGTIVAVAGGVGVAEIIPVIKELRKVNNKIITIVGVRCKDLIILEDELKQESDLLLFATNDGTHGVKGFVTDILNDVLIREKVDMVYAIGPVPMMKAISEITKEKHIETLVSLNPIMLDGSGMCGACRVSVNGNTKFVCVDGPDFNAHLLNWEEIVSRLELFKNFEKISIDKFKNNRNCKCHKE